MRRDAPHPVDHPPPGTGRPTGRTSFSSRILVICRCCSAASASSVSGSLPEPFAQGLEHLLGAPARGVDQEHVPEPLLVLAVPGLERAQGLVARRRGARLLAAGPRRTAALPDPRVRGERLAPVLGREPLPHVVGGLQQRVEGGERPRRLQPGRPRSRAAAGEHALLEHLGRLRVEPPDAERAPAVVGHPAVHPEPRHAAVRMDVEADVGRSRRRVDREREPPMRPELAMRQDLGPLGVRVRHGVVHHADLERTGVGVVALEVRRVDLDALDLGLGRQPEHDPVVALAPPAPRLPPVVHAVRVAGRDQVVRRGEEQVARVEHDPARQRRRDVGPAAGVGERSQIRERLAVDAEPRDPAVREDVEPEVRDPERRGDVEPVARIALERGLRAAGRTTPPP